MLPWIEYCIFYSGMAWRVAPPWLKPVPDSPQLVFGGADNALVVAHSACGLIGFGSWRKKACGLVSFPR
ncbi:hypothetical protein CHELA20_50030 [Hyphomicrobiales bacterium]|nr:hypothetical protein CHELA20_50030 [Hyphomicrobiales bacterium]